MVIPSDINKQLKKEFMRLSLRFRHEMLRRFIKLDFKTRICTEGLTSVIALFDLQIDL